MKLLCPKCGSRFEMEQAVRELEQSETHDIAAKLGQHWRIANEYINCWRMSEYGTISLAKKVRKLKEVAELFDTLTFARYGKKYRTDRQKIVKGMTLMCDLNKIRITTHGYLYSILTESADRLSAEGLTAKEEQDRESLRQSQGRIQAKPGRFDFKDIANNLGKGDVS